MTEYCIPRTRYKERSGKGTQGEVEQPWQGTAGTDSWLSAAVAATSEAQSFHCAYFGSLELWLACPLKSQEKEKQLLGRMTGLKCVRKELGRWGSSRRTEAAERKRRPQKQLMDNSTGCRSHCLAHWWSWEQKAALKNEVFHLQAEPLPRIQIPAPGCFWAQQSERKITALTSRLRETCLHQFSKKWGFFMKGFLCRDRVILS